MTKVKKKSFLDKRTEIIREAYERGKADALRNFNPETNKLTAEATTLLYAAADAEHHVGDQRLAYIMRGCLEVLGDMEVVAAFKKDEGILSDIDLSKQA